MACRVGQTILRRGHLPLLRRAVAHSDTMHVHLRSALAHQVVRYNSSTPNSLDSSEKKEGTLLDKIKNSRFGKWYFRKLILQRGAQTTYHSCTEEAIRSGLIQHCKLPDTFQSWFLVTHLHIWMCMVRAKKEGQDGHYVCQQLVTLFWYDVEHRIKLAGVKSRNIVQGSTKELSSMFYGLLFAFDEGIVSDDAVLASAVWRNLFAHCRDETSMQEIVPVVEYIRSYVRSLDSISTEDYLENGFRPVVHFGPSYPSPSALPTALPITAAISNPQGKV